MTKSINEKYEVTTNGVVINSKSGRELLYDESNGYRRVTLSIDSVKTRHSVHRLVANAFLPTIEGKDFVNHINGDKKDNRVENLEWCNNQENMVHARDVLNNSFIYDCSPKKVICDNGNIYFSIRETSKHEGIAAKTVRNRLRIGIYRYG
jgi:hypothetical protein